MIIRGLLEQVIPGGYERRLIVRSGGRLVCCALLQHDEYLEPTQESRHFRVGSEVSLKVALTMAEVTAHGLTDVAGFHQPIAESPHAVVTGDVVGVDSTDSCVLALGEHEALSITFERNTALARGTRARITGEFSVISHAGGRLRT